ncbi:hypothetical protein SDC9_113390 [bioreactor metagenome]|uniref:Uncharacterized protein n=1 Tax=bioreactor metagenome TaxID=1076179 RepID=A0A645BTB7_9ZZZZ
MQIVLERLVVPTEQGLAGNGPDHGDSLEGEKQRGEYGCELLFDGMVPAFFLSIQLLGVGENQKEIEYIGDDGKQENGGIRTTVENQKSGDQGRDSSSPLRPSPGMSVVVGLLVLPPLDAQVVKDHRLVGSGTEGIAKGIGNHGHEQYHILVGKKKKKESGDIGQKGERHGDASSHTVCKDARGNLGDIYQDLPNCVQRPNLQIAESLVQEDKHHEGLIEPKVLQKPIGTKLCVLHIFGKCSRRHVLVLPHLTASIVLTDAVFQWKYGQ